MNSAFSLYTSGSSFIHVCDARIKLIALLAVSLAVLLVKSWIGVCLVAAIVFGAVLLAKLPLLRLFKLSIPLVILLIFIWVCNAFTFSVDTSSAAQGLSAGFMAGWEPMSLWGNFGFNPQGCMTSLMYAVRILILFFASHVVSFTTAAEELTFAFSFLLSFLRRFRIPVDDIATMLSLAIRFIPMLALESLQIRKAQTSRGARFESGGLWSRVVSWRTVFIPLIVSMFRRAAVLGQAMEARCYGAGKRTSLNSEAVSRAQLFCSALLLCVCIVLVVFL